MLVLFKIWIPCFHGAPRSSPGLVCSVSTGLHDHCSYSLYLLTYDFHRLPRASTDGFHELPQASTGFHGLPWAASTEFHRLPRASTGSFHTLPRASTDGFHRTPRASKSGFHGTPRDPTPMGISCGSGGPRRATAVHDRFPCFQEY